MERTHISVGWHAGHPQRRYYLLNIQGPRINLKVHVDRLSVRIGSIEGVVTVDVNADDDTVVVTRNTEGRDWEEIEKDLAGVFSNTLNITPNFLYHPF